MYDQSFNTINLLRSLRKSDFLSDKKLYKQEHKDQIINEAVSRAGIGFDTPLNFSQSKVKGSPVYKLCSLPDQLVIRKTNLNIKAISRVKQRNRDTIVRNLKSFLSEGLPYRIYRLDIRKFYESFEINGISAKLEKNQALSAATRRSIDTLLTKFSEAGIKGLPRGLSLSSALAEFMMKEVDKSISEIKDVFFYSRYVDDIIIITSKKEDQHIFIEKIKRLLPKSLYLNKNKTKIINIDPITPQKSNDQFLANLEFLGYKFSIYNPKENKNHKPQFRKTIIDVADNKVRKIKTKVMRSLIDYFKSGDFQLLENRIKLLTNNYNVLDRTKGIRIKVGIYYNYHRVDFFESNALPELDRFLKGVITNPWGKNIKGSKFSLSTNQKSILLAQSFKKGFEKKSFVHFNASEQREIQRCWTYA